MSAGEGGFGQLGTGRLEYQESFAPLLDAAGISRERLYRVWCGPFNSGALGSSGTLFTWGSNSEGQCGVGTLEDVTRHASFARLYPTADLARQAQLTLQWSPSLSLSLSLSRGVGLPR